MGERWGREPDAGGAVDPVTGTDGVPLTHGGEYD